MAVSYGYSMFNFLTNCQAVFPSGCTVYISTASVWELQFLQIFATFVIVCFFLIIAILAEVISDYLVSDYLDEVVVWFWYAFP